MKENAQDELINRQIEIELDYQKEIETKIQKLKAKKAKSIKRVDELNQQ